MGDDYDGKFFCHGDILLLLLGDQFHDFIGERAKKTEASGDQDSSGPFDESEASDAEVSDKKQNSFINTLKDNFKEGWGYILNDIKDKGYKQKFIDIINGISPQGQSYAEKIIKENSSEILDLKLGDSSNFKYLSVKKGTEIKYQEKLGEQTRKYIQLISKTYGKDIEITDDVADVKIDALASNKNFVSAMLDLPTSELFLDKQCQLPEGYNKQIKYTPILPNIYDEAPLDGIYYSSAANNGKKYNEKIKNYEEYSIVDEKGNQIEWAMLQAPRFWDIALWKTKSEGKLSEIFSDHTDNMKKFIDRTKTSFTDEEREYFLYKSMVKSCYIFLNKKITLKNGKQFMLFNKIEDFLGKELPKSYKPYGSNRNVKLLNTFTFTTGRKMPTKIVFSKDKEYFEEAAERVLMIFDKLFEKISETSLFLYYLGCMPVKLDKDFMEQFIFKSFGLIIDLKITVSGQDPKEFDNKYLIKPQTEQIGAKGNLSVSKVYNQIKNFKSIIIQGKKISQEQPKLALFLLKTLADLSITTSSFYKGTLDRNKVNFLTTQDITSASIATTLTKYTAPEQGHHLYKHILLQKSGLGGISAYNLDIPTLISHEEYNLTDIFSDYNLQTIDKGEKEFLDRSEQNCELFKELYLETPYMKAFAKQVGEISCINTLDRNMNILEPILPVELPDVFVDAREQQPRVSKRESKRKRVQEVLEPSDDQDVEMN